MTEISDHLDRSSELGRDAQAKINALQGLKPVVVTGGDTAHGEVVRGDVLLVHYDEAKANPDYARDALREAEDADAPSVVIESLTEIILAHDDNPEVERT